MAMPNGTSLETYRPPEGPLQVPTPAPTATGQAASRVWQACVACRRKKIKCDGQQPCHNCSSREAPCDYPGSKDNASHSRSYAMAFEAQCQQLDVFSRRLENLTSELHRSIETLQQHRGTNTTSIFQSAEDELLQAAHALRSLPQPRLSGPDPGPDASEPSSVDPTDIELNHQSIVPINDDDDDDSSQASDDLDHGESFGAGAGTTRFGSLVTDSYGRLRFVGGATNDMLIEAVKSLTPGQSIIDPDSPHMSKDNATTGATQSQDQEQEQPREPTQRQPVEIPLFTHGQVWPELSLLPGPEKLSRPPQYVGDLLVGLYFDQLHYMLPVLYKPHFMARYETMKASSSTTTTPDKRFLMVFFAVCACASSLIPSNGSAEPARFPGIDHYQKSLLLSFATTGEASLERVQCLALLAMCSAGWNTLSQSWTFAGQAVRAAQDLGIHLSNLATPSLQHSSSASRLRTEISRRVWWSIYCLDRVTSTCLGRPMAANDADCHCALPMSAADEELQEMSRHKSLGSARQMTSSSSSMTSFVAFARLCHIAGKIQALHSPRRIRDLAAPAKVKRLAKSVVGLDRSLQQWLESLPKELRSSASVFGPKSAMNVIMGMVHAGLLLNLYRSLAGKVDSVMLGGIDPISQCITAARSCINAAELLRELVPPSHHLAICIHYLTLSGVVLLRMTERSDLRVRDDVDKCVACLKDLEATWAGARKSRLIIEQLDKEADSGSGNHDQNLLLDFENAEVLSWLQIPGGSTFFGGFDGGTALDPLDTWDNVK